MGMPAAQYNLAAGSSLVMGDMVRRRNSASDPSSMIGVVSEVVGAPETRPQTVVVQCVTA